jgi:cell fate regulator YaaT (PSP1 superfamily)
MQNYFVRIGSWGDIARCRTAGGEIYRRGTRVICRTPRGLEIGQITGDCGSESEEDVTGAWPTVTERADESGGSPDRDLRVQGEIVEEVEDGGVVGVAENSAAFATILRATTAEDELLLSRLETHRRDAIVECRACLAAAGSAAILLDVDQVFDAGTLVFYFLNPPDQRDTELVQRLAASYESRVRSGHFAKLLAAGCGPGCGTKSCDEGDADAGVAKKRGCSGSCAVCVVARR